MEPLKSPNGLTKVRFIKSYMAYPKGTEAGFQHTEAVRLQDMGLAEIQYKPAAPGKLSRLPQPGEPGLRVPDSTVAPGSGNRPAAVVTIPDDWQAMHHTRLVALAKALGADVSSKADAVAAIETELSIRAGDGPDRDGGLADQDDQDD